MDDNNQHSDDWFFDRLEGEKPRPVVDQKKQINQDSEQTSGAVFWIEVEKINPNPLQPRRDFDQVALESLAQSISEYGVLQPLIVSRLEKETPYGQSVEYELLAGERRLRASKIAGLQRVPVIIRREPDNRLKLELALIENVQREDLNPIDRAIAFQKLIEEFNMLQKDLATRVGRSREMVSNTLRLLTLPEIIQEGLRVGKISEGHARPLLALVNNQNTQVLLYQEIIARNLSVRDTERVSKRIRQRSGDITIDPAVRDIKQKLEDALGTRVSVNRKGQRWQVSIELFSDEEFNELLRKLTPPSV